jgi:hypothetical protein
MWLETIKLGFHNNLLVGNMPHKVKMSKVVQQIAKRNPSKEDLMSFGLFDVNVGNYNTYYPGVTAKDLKPSKSEFIEPMFRALSEVVVHKTWNPVDFSRNSVLRKSTILLRGQTVNVDHETAVANAIGAVSYVEWQESYKGQHGLIIPAGINAILKIDGKSHPKVARAIMMDPPAIHSTSVTVQFLWDKSHPSMSQEDFFKNLGSYDQDGKLITRVATEIKRFNEISLVSHGADPFAQKIGADGKINNPLYAATSLSANNVKLKKRQKVFFYDFKTDTISNSEKVAIPKKITNNNNSAMKSGMKLIAVLAATLGLKLDEKNPNVTEIKNTIKGLQKEKAEASKALAAAKKALKAKEKEALALQAKTERLSAFRKETLTKLRKEVVRNYTLANKGVANKETVEMLKKADLATLSSLNKEYARQLEESCPITCKDCGSENVNRASAQLGNDDIQVKPEDIPASIAQKANQSALSFMHS